MQIKKFLSIVLSLIMVFLSLPLMAVNSLAAEQYSMDKLKTMFPSGKYWTHKSGDSSWTVKTVSSYGVGTNGYVGNYQPDGSSQCHGFACVLAEYYSGTTAKESRYSKGSSGCSVDNIRVGDKLRIDVNGNGVNDDSKDHTVFVIAVSNSDITVAECNWACSGTNKINWGRTISKSSLRTSMLYLDHYKKVAQTPTVTVSSISIQSKPTKTVYTVGEKFSSSGLSIKVNMSDGTSKTITSGFTVSSPNMTTAGTKTVTVTYQGKTTTFTITVNNPGIAVNANNFPDANFRNYVSVNVDKDSNGELSEAEIKDTIFIVVEDSNITTLKGIEYFTAIEFLNCTGNQLTSLDLSKNTMLKYFYCDNNQLTSLDVSKHTALEILSCDNNQLTSLDVSNNTVLEYFYCINNRLTNLDISKNNKLVDLNCYNNQLTKLDVSKNVVLEHLYCSSNQLTSLDVSRNILLKELYCPDNQLTSLDVSNNTALENLACYNNQLTSLDVSNNTALTVLDCSNNKYIMEIDKNGNFDLSTLLGNFDVNKASNWNGASVKGNILTVNNGADTVTYTYDMGNEKTETFTLVIANPVFATVSSISIQTKPTKTVYTVGEEFSSSGLSVKVNMSDGTSKTVTSGFTVSSPDMKTAGTKTVTVTYEGKTATFNITVNAPVSPTAAQYKISGATATAGSTVEVYVSIENNPGIISLRNKITYDTSVMELVKVEDMKLLAGHTTPSPTVSSPYTLRWADSLATENNKANGNFVKLTFKIKNSAAVGDYCISVSHIESRTVNGEKVEFADCSAVIKVVDYLLGDVDGNGEIDDWDAIVLNRYLAGWQTEIIEAAADMDGDGELTDWDAIALERRLAGWNV